MKQSSKLKNGIMIACLIVLLVFTISIVVRLFTRQVLILKLGIKNAVTDLIFWDNEAMASAENIEEDESALYNYDWVSLYPFEETDVAQDQDRGEVKTDAGFLSGYTSAISSLKGRIENYTQDDLAGYTKITELGRGYEKLVGWNFASFNEYNGTYQLPDGYWTSMKEERNVSEHITSTVRLQSFCEKEGIDFLFVMAPYKVSKYTDPEVAGVVDFSNQNADDFLDGLCDHGVAILDLREKIYTQGLDHHSLFFITDHHWTGKTGLWAAGKIGAELNARFGFEIDINLFNIGRYEEVVYPDWFLGSYGKKVTQARANPEDISLLYPAFETNMSLEIPAADLMLVGDFSVTYNMKEIEEIDYYNKNPYGAYGYGDQALKHFENLDSTDGKKVLIIRDSFADAVEPFLALGMEYMDCIDLRYFTGSLETYIRETAPDLVLILYNAGEFMYDVKYDHTNLFDFK